MRIVLVTPELAPLSDRTGVGAELIRADEEVTGWEVRR